MKPMIFFSDLAHRGHSCNAMPFAISLVLAYALKKMPGAFDYKIFKRTEDLTQELDQDIPHIICFSNYIWNASLSYEIARRVKERAPKTIVIFGGPNYPIRRKEQEQFLRANPAIDFYVYRDGDLAFTKLLEALLETGLDAQKIKAEKRVLPSCHYVTDDSLVVGAELLVPNDLDEIPSPYLTGLLDPFFEMNLVPLVLTTRGCPFSCTYCQDGLDYTNKVKRHSRAFIDDELEYIARRTKAPRLQWADLNFGMYTQDLDTCRTLARLRETYGWPQFVDLHGKNKKERILEAARIIDGPNLDGGAVFFSASVQSTDPDVLDAVKRRNISTNVMLDLVTRGHTLFDNSFSEVILCLPRDTRAAHLRSLEDLMDTGVSTVRSHQFLLLHGSEAATTEDRERFGMVTRYRVCPRTTAEYHLFGEAFVRPEIDEVCVANNTLSYQDYLECRQFDLTVEIFHNHGLFREIMALLITHDVRASAFIRNIFDLVLSTTTPLSPVYAGFLRETEELWETAEEVEEFLRQPGVPEKYRDGELGNNEQLMYRALAVFNHMRDLHDLVYALAQEHLAKAGGLDAITTEYLDELKAFSLLRKTDLLDTQRVVSHTFHYDFSQLRGGRETDVAVIQNNRRDDGITFEFFHNDSQRKMIRQFIDIYGTDNYGLGNILGGGTNVTNFYRTYRTV